MIELPDDELDKLFRKSSEEFDPHFDPEDWNSLKKRLDETGRENSGRMVQEVVAFGAVAVAHSGWYRVLLFAK
jgi:hypothetical protein